MPIVGLLVSFALWIGTIRSVPPSPPQSEAELGLARGITSMHSAMKRVPFSGNPDADFAAAMVAHHQGAIEMAKVELQFGQDLRLRRLAQEIIVTQQSEIDVMKGALKDDGRSAAVWKRNDWCTQ